MYKEKTFTPYTRFGDWFPRLVLAFLLVVLIVNVLPKKGADRPCGLSREAG